MALLENIINGFNMGRNFKDINAEVGEVSGFFSITMDRNNPVVKYFNDLDNRPKYELVAFTVGIYSKVPVKYLFRAVKDGFYILTHDGSLPPSDKE